MAATPKDVSLSDSDRKIILEALKLKLASALRASKSASNEAVSAAHTADAQATESLIVRFR